MLIGFNSRRGSRKPTCVAAEIQLLETRQLLTGNVVVSGADKQSISIVGDNKANDVSIAVDATGVITITGKNGTTINGGSDPFQPSLKGVTDHFKINNLRISLKGGDDKLTIDIPSAAADVTITGKVTINTGSGKDVVSVLTDSQLNVDGGMSINLGSGDDALSIQGSAGLAMGNALRINGGTGNDAIALVNEMKETTTGVKTKRLNVSIKGGAGDDQIAASALEVSHNLTVAGGRGKDKIAVSDKVGDTSSATSVAGNAKITGGAGNDTLSLAGSITVDKNLSINLGAGNDDLAVASGATINVTGKSTAKGGSGTNNADTTTLSSDLSGAKVTGFTGTTAPTVDDLAAILAVVNGLIT